VVVTAPGRQAANSGDLVAALERAARRRVHVLSPEDEARLAFAGAVGAAQASARVVAVADLGGASTEIAIGRPAGPVWLRSIELGALRLTSRRLHSSHAERDVEAARRVVREAFAGIAPPLRGSASAAHASCSAPR
jgi:exopolyphosphatase/guanosine-5'-triphosphate,3'-diphosphate pyrophosphatase